MKHTDTHVKVERMLRAAGWSPLRQFEPRKDEICIKDEHFEMWRNAKGGKVLVVHYLGEHGVDFYSPMLEANTWGSVEQALAAIS